MPTDVDTDGGSQLGRRSRGHGASVRYVSSPVPSGRGALRAAVRERTVSFAHTAIAPHTGVEAMRADRPVAAERPSRRAGRDDARRAADERSADAPGRVFDLKRRDTS